MNYCNCKKKCLSSLSMQSAQRSLMCWVHPSFLPPYLWCCGLTALLSGSELYRAPARVCIWTHWLHHLYLSYFRYCKLPQCILPQSYADDTQLYLTFDPKESNGLETAFRTLSACVMDIKAWMCRNKLKLNEGKTEFIVVGSSQNLRNLNNVCPNLGTTQKFPSTSIKNLGVYFDSNMSMSGQIDNICKSVRFQIKNMSQIRKYITRDACNHAVRSHVISRLDYCNGLLTEVPSVQLSQLIWILYVAYK